MLAVSAPSLFYVVGLPLASMAVCLSLCWGLFKLLGGILGEK